MGNPPDIPRRSPRPCRAAVHSSTPRGLEGGTRTDAGTETAALHASPLSLYMLSSLANGSSQVHYKSRCSFHRSGLSATDRFAERSPRWTRRVRPVGPATGQYRSLPVAAVLLGAARSRRLAHSQRLLWWGSCFGQYAPIKLLQPKFLKNIILCQKKTCAKLFNYNANA